MTIVLILAILVLWFLVTLIYSVRIRRGEISTFEVGRRADMGDPSALKAAERETYLESLNSLRYALIVFLMLLILLLCFYVTHPIFALGAVFVMLLLSRAFSRMKAYAQLAHKYYTRFEPFLLKHKGIWSWLSFFNEAPEIIDEDIQSRPEFEHLIDRAHSVLTKEEQISLKSLLAFEKRTVKETMKLRSEVTFVKAAELLGPLMIDELHKTGFSRFPVYSPDVDHIVGTLYLRDLFPLPTKDFGTVSKLMKHDVYYIREDMSLEKALAAFIKTKHHLFIVIDHLRQTVGIITLEDVLEALIGRVIEDEFDQHDNKQAVADRKLNQTASSSVDV